MVRPYNMRDCPTAKSAMSIISCTSPSPSALILPFSMDTRLPSASLYLRSSSPMSRTAHGRGHHLFIVLRRGAAHLRQALAGGRIDGIDQRAAALAAPALAAGP